MDEVDEEVYLSTPEEAQRSQRWRPSPTLLLLVALVGAAFLVVSGVDQWSRGAALIVAGVLLAGIASLSLVDV